MESGRISNFQAAMLAITSLTIMGHLILLTLVIGRSRQDGWLASIVGTLLSLAGIYALTKLAQKYPRESFIEVLFGRLGWPGKLIGILYLGYFYLMATLAVRLFVEAYKTIMRETPAAAFVAVLLLLCGYIAFLGLETMARMNQIVLPILVLTAIAVSLLTMAEKDYARLLPIMANGLSPVSQGSLAVVGWFGEFVVMGMVLPYVQRPERLLRANVLVAGIVLLFFLGPVTGPVASFGSQEAANMVFPSFTEIRYIHIGKYVNRFDLVAVLFWTVGLTFRCALFFYALCLGTAQALKAPSYRPLILPFLWLVAVGAFWFSSNYQELKQFLFRAYVPLNLLMGYGLPLALLGILAFLARRQARS